MAAGAELCVRCGFNRRTGQMRMTRMEAEPAEEAEPKAESRPSVPEDWAERWRRGGLDAFLDFEIPLGLLVGGFGFILVVHLATIGFADLGALVVTVAFHLLLQVGWGWAALVTIEWISGREYGSMLEVPLKLSGIVLLWMALMVGPISWHPAIGLVVLSIIGVPVPFLLLMWLFELDLFWTIITCLAIEAVNWSTCFLIPFAP